MPGFCMTCVYICVVVTSFMSPRKNFAAWRKAFYVAAFTRLNEQDVFAGGFSTA